MTKDFVVHLLSVETASCMSSNQVREYQIVVIGGGGVGKSALTVQFIQGHFIDEYDPTIEDSYRKECTVDGEPIVMDVLDTAGQEEYSAMREHYMRSGQGFLLVYSVTSRSSFEEVSSFYQQILRAKDVDEFPVVLVGNKIDLGAQREVSYDEGQRFAKKMKAPFFETSAKERINVTEAFKTLAQQVVRVEKTASGTQKLTSPHTAPARQSQAAAPAAKQPETTKKSGCCIIS